MSEIEPMFTLAQIVHTFLKKQKGKRPLGMFWTSNLGFEVSEKKLLLFILVCHLILKGTFTGNTPLIKFSVTFIQETFKSNLLIYVN